MDAQEMMGYAKPGDQKVALPVRHWNAMKLAVWRSKVALGIAERAASEIVGRCEHAEGCLGKEYENEPCSIGCRDREIRMSALVVLNAARTFAPINAQRIANEPYFAPSREHFSEIVAELAATQAEVERLRDVLRAAGVEPPAPTQTPPALQEST